MTTTVAELGKLMHARGLLATAEDLRVPVEVRDVRVSYGNTQVYVIPVGGTGGAWVMATRLQLTSTN